MENTCLSEEVGVKWLRQWCEVCHRRNPIEVRHRWNPMRKAELSKVSTIFKSMRLRRGEPYTPGVWSSPAELSWSYGSSPPSNASFEIRPLGFTLSGAKKELKGLKQNLEFPFLRSSLSVGVSMTTRAPIYPNCPGHDSRRRLPCTS